ncbi:MAG TPA: type I 3-dehydroquinate dehydratase [Tepidisphaeraceae bacterium]|nr:type I 3-dehydroquinate dehydratase [Tepidisphaeraceae bacterium]
MTHLCVPIYVHTPEQAKRDAAVAAENGADLVEFRIDTFTDAERLKQLLTACVLPCVVTCRSAEEGGRGELSDEERLAVLDLPGMDCARYVDVELATFRKLPNPAAVGERRLILSSHDFQGRPDRLYNILAEQNASPADVTKVVWTARTVRDNLEAFEILMTRQKPTIALCMGEAGLLSRVLAKKFGAFLTFASLAEGAGTAPGQVTIAEMKRLYRWDAIRPETKVYGVVGSPVGHSMSPAIHNAGFERVGWDGVYVPLLVNEGYESFKAFMESFLAFGPLHLSGLSVTIPHKENALRYLKEKGAEVDELAERIGALNTIVIAREGEAPSGPRLRGFSTDYAAILDSITSALGITREGLKGYRVAVLGAGGTGRTAVAALAQYGATVVVYNRTRGKADALAAEFNGLTGKVVAADWAKLCDSCCQIYVNTTSVGMSPRVDESPFGDAPPELGSGHLVFEAIYNPMETRLLKYARERGAKTVGGVEMFVRQAAGQFEAWTGRPAPAGLMREVVEGRLSPSPGRAG